MAMIRKEVQKNSNAEEVREKDKRLKLKNVGLVNPFNVVS